MTQPHALPKLPRAKEIPRPLLNRLFIVIGVLAILAIAAAFVVPGMIDWSGYRDRMQAIAGEVLGADVEIVGDIEFSLLPQPQLRVSEIRVGEADDPVLTVEQAEAQFSLLDFLRDRYLITRLVLERPTFDVGIDENGKADFGIALAREVSTSNVSVASAEIVDGALAIADARSGYRFAATDVDGELRMEAVRGPFRFQGTGDYDGQRFTTRLATSAFDGSGVAQLTAFMQPLDESFSLNAEGLLSTGDLPRLEGTLTYRQAPPPAGAEGDEGDIGRGDMVVTGKLEADATRVLLSEYVIVPDENRGATRLTGAAEVKLGQEPSFNAVISGGVLSLPPRDATANPATMPYELVRLLAELPVPPVPAIPGTIGVDVAEVGLRVLSLREVRFDARVDGESWAISNFVGRLPGDTELRLSGSLQEIAGKPEFAGDVRIATRRLDALAALWRKPDEGNPLLNVPGALEARLSLVGETLSVSDAELTVEDATHAFSAEIGFAPTGRHLNVRSVLGTLTARQSTELLALLPDAAADPQFGASFPNGRFELSATAITLGGLAGTDLSAQGSWEGGVLALDALHLGDLGGMSLDAQLTAFGTLQKPELSGHATLAVARASAPALGMIFDAVRTPTDVRRWLESSLPAKIALVLDAPTGQGEQGLRITGTAGAADVTLSALLGEGFARALQGSMALEVELSSDDPAALTAQLGLGAASFTPPDQPMSLVAVIEGNPANSFETTVRIDGGGEEFAFAGNIVAADLAALSGNGNLRVKMSDFSGLTENLGAGGIWVPPLEGSARVDFNPERIRLQSIEAVAGGEPFSGTLEWVRSDQAGTVTGEIAAGAFDPRGLLAVLAGPAATISSGTGFWPDGPTAIGEAPRRTTGRIAVTSPAIFVDDEMLVSDTSFDLTWDATGIRIRNFTGAIGGGTLTAELGVCCAGSSPLKTVTARVSLADVAFASLVPKPVADAIAARVTASARLEGSGDSLLGAIQAMTAEGSYTLTDVSIAGFDPGAFAAVDSLEAVLDMEPAAVAKLVIDRLDDSAFTSPTVSGGFTIAGGVLRSPNLAIEGEGARLFGSTSLRLADLSLGGGFVMSPTMPSGPDGLLTEANAQIAADFSGTLPAPERTINVAGVVDTMMIEALELEVVRLEQIRAEDQARQREAAAERERVAAEEAARRAAAEAETRRAAEEEEARRAAEEAAAEAVPEPEGAADQPIVLQPGFNLEPPASFF